jgi:hypothetical protein
MIQLERSGGTPSWALQSIRRTFDDDQAAQTSVSRSSIQFATVQPSPKIRLMTADSLLFASVTNIHFHLTADLVLSGVGRCHIASQLIMMQVMKAAVLSMPRRYGPLSEYIRFANALASTVRPA